MILDGRKLAHQIADDLASQKVPEGKLAVVQVGSDPVSTLYVSKKKEMADTLRVQFLLAKFDEQIGQQELISEIKKLNQDDLIRGIIVQIPLPSHIDRLKIAGSVAWQKDIDGFHYILQSQNFSCVPPTVLAIVELLDFYKIPIQGQKIIIVGGGFLVGQPLFNFFKNKDLDVRILEKNDAGYEKILFDADIAVVSTGGGREFKQEEFKDGATIIDASTVSEEGKIKGDIVYDESWPTSKNIAPVPGGVGPVTVAMLFKNFYFNL